LVRWPGPNITNQFLVVGALGPEIFKPEDLRRRRARNGFDQKRHMIRSVADERPEGGVEEGLTPQGVDEGTV
jgi:hypothetical protein